MIAIILHPLVIHWFCRKVTPARCCDGDGDDDDDEDGDDDGYDDVDVGDDVDIDDHDDDCNSIIDILCSPYMYQHRNYLYHILNFSWKATLLHIDTICKNLLFQKVLVL